MNTFFPLLIADEMPPRDQGVWHTFVMIGILLLFFYFMMWRPEQKRRKTLDAQRNAMKKGDKVTAMGIVGIVNKVQEQTVILKMVDGAKIEVLKGAITEVIPTAESAA
ncbi:MAG: preprotein translocase subunit YajC [Chlamydiia bacterium]|nr:preprotein translocase subunit YajC [Chlamydiia bacterium]